MTILRPVEHLYMCLWIDQLGQVQRQTFSANELVPHDPGHLTWLKALVRLSARWKVAGTY